MKKLSYLLLSFTLLVSAIQAQDCNDITATATVTPSTCQSNGSITINLSGTSVGSLIGKQYSLKSTTGSIAIGPVSTNVFNNLPAGNYNLEVAAFCNTLNGAEVIRTINNVTVGGSYTEPRLSFVAAGATSIPAIPTSRNSYKGCDTGLIVLFLENGNQTTMPTFTITSAPAGVTVPQAVTATKATSGSATTGWRYTLNGTWPAGTYNVTVNDGCYSSTVSFNIKELTEVPSGSSSYSYFNPYTADEPNCSKVRYYQYYNYDAINYPDFNRYARDGLYEYGLAPIGELPTAENWFPITQVTSYTNSSLFNLPGKLSDYYGTPNKLAVYTRLKNCPSAITSVTVYITNPSLTTSSTSNSCEGTRTYTATRWTDRDGIYCYPLTIRITDQATGALKYEDTNFLYSSASVSWTCKTGESFYRNITDANGRPLETNIPLTGIPATDAPVPTLVSLDGYSSYRYCDSYDRPYYSTYPCDKGYPNPVYVTITDNTGAVVQKDTMTSQVTKYARNLKYGVTYTYTFSYPNSTFADKTLTGAVSSTIPASFTLTKSSTSVCFDNRGVLRVEAKAAAFGSGYMKIGTITTITGPAGYESQTTTRTYDGDYSSNYTYFPETYLPPGEYTATIVSCGTTYTVPTTIAAGYTADKLSYTLEQDCMGTKVFPSGSISNNGVPLSTVYFRMTSAPAGSGANSKVIASTNTTDYFSLTTAGTYILGVMTSNSLTGCAIKYDTIQYNPIPLALDREKTSAYSCPGGSTGYLTLQATNGVLPYTYSVYDETNTTQLVAPIELSTALDLGSFGVANETYTIRMSDACGNSFSQQVTLVSLDRTALAYGQELVCYDSSISIFGFTVTNATYSWTGPNGFTSTSKNALIPNATPADGGWYYVDIHSLACNITVRDSIFITVYDPVVPNELNGKTQEVTLCPYQRLTIGQAATGGSGKTSYQWQYNTNALGTGTWSNIAGETSAIFTATVVNYIFTSTTSSPPRRYLRVMVNDEDCGIYYLYYHTNVKGCMFLVNPDLKSPGAEN